MYINIEHVSYASYGSRKWGDSSEQNKQKNPCPHGAYILVGGDK